MNYDLCTGVPTLKHQTYQAVKKFFWQINIRPRSDCCTFSQTEFIHKEHSPIQFIQVSSLHSLQRDLGHNKERNLNGTAQKVRNA